jgi:cytochrome c2
MRSARRKPWLAAAAVGGLAALYGWWRWSLAMMADEDQDQAASETRDKAPLEKLLAGLAAIAVAVALWFGWQAYSFEKENAAVARAITGGDPANAETYLLRYGCAGCHTIPGIPGADGQVGPVLSGLQKRVYVGGVLRNSTGNLIAWIVEPQRYSPNSAMPITGISPAEARDVAAYLYGH